ncbi:ATP-binding protein [Rhodanobacter sp. AS-Z3]|uniref:ATP-binding protein n=1 Tax=Rhodanobacter sp. AS-Z3 TaxID=3031330 RepID=UPI0024785D1A|nr:ATP-binding protein [Rhodanobacter sp. AS-Z3]WEN13761.1 ATP-binding protein [Rhodanobacter sp. AS-Z3]
MTSHANIDAALDWITCFVAGCLNVHFGKVGHYEPRPFVYQEDDSWIGRFVKNQDTGACEFALLMLALLPHLHPGVFDKLLAEHMPGGGEFPELGGTRGAGYRSFLPTGETAQFVLAGSNFEGRLEVQHALSAEQWLGRQRVLWVEPVREGEPAMSGRLIVNPEIVEEIVTGKVGHPAFSTDFPAEHIETPMDWDDLVLNPMTRGQIREIEHWIKHNDTLMSEWGMRKRVKPGYRALFYGPPGTGKTLSAMLLGKHTGKEVFRVDLSRVVSKYIGETEKNLSRLFDKAENKNWILFFDEADALFSKRTEVRDAHDKYANQEVAYLLQRIEGYNGLVILASNQRANIDDAFVRRLQAIIPFPVPRQEERYEIWRRTFPAQIALAGDVDWRHIAARHELTGANILNVTHFCAIEALANESLQIDLKSLETAIRREYVKEGKVM